MQYAVYVYNIHDLKSGNVNIYIYHEGEGRKTLTKFVP
jgi:hypothetical protein